VLQTMKEFMKLQMEKEVSTIPQTIDDYVRQYNNINSEQLQ